MAASPPAVLLSISKQFLASYYKVMSQTPELLHKFYKDNSSFTFGSETTYGSTSNETVSGLEAILKKIKELDFHDSQVSLFVVDVQASQNGGVLLVVVGQRANKGEAPRKFVQSFFLAEQSKDTVKGYYVLNDIFRYVEVQPDISTYINEEPSSEEKQPLNTQPNEVNNAAAVKETRPTVQTPPPVEVPVQQPTKQVQEAANSVQKKEEQPPKPSVTPVKETPPPAEEKHKSWVNVINKPGGSPQNEQPQQPVKKATPSPQTPQAVPVRKEEKIASSSLFVSNVPFNATEADIRRTFVKFGEIKSLSINNQKGFIFLDMATPDLALKIIEHSKNKEILMDGRVLHAEKKQSKPDRGPRGDKDREDRPRGDKGERRDRGEKINGKASATRDQSSKKQ